MTRKGFLRRREWIAMFTVGLMSMLLTALLESAQGLIWEQTNGPYGGNIQALLATSDGTLYAGTGGGGVFRSKDKGNTWTAVNTGLAHGNITSLAIMGTTLFAGAMDGGTVYFSEDGGDTWIRTELNINVWSLAVMGTTLFAGTHDRGVFRSKDKGDTWTEVSKGLTNTTEIRKSLAVMGTTLFVGIYGGGIFRSDDEGNTWTEVNTGLTNKNITSLTVMGTTLFVGTEDGIFRSKDRGNTWIKVYNNDVKSLAVMGITLFAGKWGRIFRSDDGGDNWTENKVLANTEINSLTVMDTTLYAGTGGGGVFRSDDKGNTWTEVNKGLTNMHVSSFAAMGTTLFAGTWSSGVFRSDDGGNTWTKVNRGLADLRVGSLAVMDTTLFASTEGGSVFRSKDRGNNWSSVSRGLGANSITSLAVMGATIFASTWGGVFLSDDGGNSWTGANRGLTNSGVSSLAVAGTVPFAGTLGGGVFRSENGGETWIPVNKGLTNTNIRSLAAASMLFAGTEDGRIFRSTNGGNSWDEVSIGMTQHHIVSLAVTGSTVFAGTPGHGVFRSDDSGAPLLYWTNVNRRLTNTIIGPLAVMGTTLFAGTAGGGVFRASLSDVTPPPPAVSQPTQPTSFSFKMSLPQGLNMVSLPVKPATSFTARSFATKLKSSFVIDLDPITKKFIAFTLQVHTGEGFTIEGGRGYIVNITLPVETIFEGSGWSKAAPPAELNPVWAFVVSGSIPNSDRLGYSRLNVRVRNRSTGQSAVESIGLLEEGKFAVALVDLSKRSVASEGDIFEVFIESSNGEVLAGPISQKIGKKEILEAQLVVNIRADEIAPKYTKLLQNYPNPFNPETWMPFQLSETAEVKVRIYDVKGNVVRTLSFGWLSAGIYVDKSRSAYWDGKNELGEKVASGVYFYSLESGKFRAVRKLAVSK